MRDSAERARLLARVLVRVRFRAQFWRDMTAGAMEEIWPQVIFNPV